MVLTQSIVYVFDINDGIVNKRTNCDAHATEGHGINFQSHEVKAENCAQQREGDGNEGDEGGAETAEKEEQNDDQNRCR